MLIPSDLLNSTGQNLCSLKYKSMKRITTKPLETAQYTSYMLARPSASPTSCFATECDLTSVAINAHTCDDDTNKIYLFRKYNYYDEYLLKIRWWKKTLRGKHIHTLNGRAFRMCWIMSLFCVRHDHGKKKHMIQVRPFGIGNIDNVESCLSPQYAINKWILFSYWLCSVLRC